MKTQFVLALAALCLVLPAEAGKRKGRIDPKVQQERKEKAQERAQDEKAREAVKRLLADKDKNDNNTLSKDEYIAGEANAEEAAANFDKFDKNGDRALSKKEMETLLGF